MHPLTLFIEVQNFILKWTIAGLFSSATNGQLELLLLFKLFRILCFINMGQSLPLFGHFHPFHITISLTIN